ncbi:MAG: HAMP domain-containing sensor histidine kinase [Methanomassiliicoccales archaeon]
MNCGADFYLQKGGDPCVEFGQLSNLELDQCLDHLKVYADPMLVKVFHNIIEDSVKYGGKPLKVKIGCTMKGRSLLMVYEDFGPGILTEEKEKIFEMGFGKGIGLGLHLSREILSITDITVRETGEQGKGVRFEIEVPEGNFRFDNESDEASGEISVPLSLNEL